MMPNHRALSSLHCGSLLKSITNSKSLNQGSQLHAHIIVCGTSYQNSYLNTKLAAFYAACGVMDAAHVIFDGIFIRNSFLWNFMIRGYACNNSPKVALFLYRQMLCFWQRADNFTYPFVLKACGDSLLVDIGRKIHSEVVITAFQSDIYVANSLLAMYSKFEDMGYARKVFDKMFEKDLTSWNTMISSYVKVGNAREALVIFYLMRSSGFRANGMTLLFLISACAKLATSKLGKSIHCYVIKRSLELYNEYLTNSLIDMYCNCDSVVYARKLFEAARVVDNVAWNSIISGYAKNGDTFECLRLFCRMASEGEYIDQVTFVAVLSACDQITALPFGMSVHSSLIKNGFCANVIVGTSLINMYTKCGMLACARCIFDKLPERNLITWSAMISGYGIHGMGKEAISCFSEMQRNKILPDEGVLTSVLSACSHAGLVVEGKEIFYCMEKDYNVNPTPAHYTCLVDILGRAGQIDEAYKLIKTMEINPTADIWAAFLNACQLHGNTELAQIAAHEVVHLNPKYMSSYVSSSKMYAADKRWDEAEKVRAIAREMKLLKTPGCSFI